MRAKSAKPDVAIARVAARQHGVVSREQLRAAGFSEAAISRRANGGRLHRIHRGVYAVGHRGLSLEGRWMAAVLACGEDARLSHRSAAELWQLLGPVDGPIEVTVAGWSGRKRRAGIRIHRSLTLRLEETTRRRGIPVTGPARTIADLRASVAPAQRRRAIRQAEVLGLSTGIKPPNEPTRSELEDLFLRLCAHYRLPAPEVNVRIGLYEVDFLWRTQRLIVETDGYRYHRGAQAFEDDRERDLGLRARGFDLHRFSYRQIVDKPRAVADAVKQALRS
jgi:hypothetical protein